MGFGLPVLSSRISFKESSAATYAARLEGMRFLLLDNGPLELPIELVQILDTKDADEHKAHRLKGLPERHAGLPPWKAHEVQAHSQDSG